MAWVKLFLKPGGNLRNSYQPGSMLSIAPAKGLLNGPGENSCFLNSAVQILWHLDIFRRSLRQLPGHVCFGNACIFCALKDIFAEFRNSREKALPSDALRNALAESFKDEHRFQLGLMDDAAECFENILERIHLHIVSDTEMDTCTAKCCITHQKFAMTLYEQSVCHSCGATSDPLPFTELVHYVSIKALCNQVDRMMERNKRPRPELFAELLQAASTIGDFRNCPSNCGQKIKIRRVLMNCPEIVTIGLVWDSENSDLTLDVIRYLALQLYLPGLFFRATDEGAKRSELVLVGMVCYSNRHYCTFAFHTKSSKWVFFDDAHVKEVGSKWKDVISKCIRSHFQPLLLFYANPYGMPVSTEDALGQVFHPVHGKMDGEDSEKEMEISAARMPEQEKENGADGHSSRGPKLPLKQLSNAKGGFQRGYIQDSRGRGLIKVFPGDASSWPRDHLKEYSQKPQNGRNPPHTQKRENDKPTRTDYGKQREDRSSKSGTPNLGNDTRHFWDQHTHRSQGKGYFSEGRTTPHFKATSDKYASDSIPHKKCSSFTGYDTDSSQDSRDRGNRSRNKGKVWKPSRETLNVDSVFEEGSRRQSNPKNKSHNVQQVLPCKGQNPNNVLCEKRRDKELMTIYEDEFKQGNESPPLEIDGKANLENEKIANKDFKIHSSGYRVQKMESGQESSIWINNDSTNHDPQNAEVFKEKHLKNNQQALSNRNPVTLIKYERCLNMPSGKLPGREVELQESENKSRDKIIHKPNMQRSQLDKNEASSSCGKARKGAPSPKQNLGFQESPGINLQEYKPCKNNYHPQTQLKQSFTSKTAPKFSANSSIEAVSVQPDACVFPFEDIKKASLVSVGELSCNNLQASQNCTVHVLSSSSRQGEIKVGMLPPRSPVDLHPVDNLFENSLSNQHKRSGELSSHCSLETKENVSETVHHLRSSPPPLPPKKYNLRNQSSLNINALNFRQINLQKEQKENPILTEVTASVKSSLTNNLTVPQRTVSQAQPLSPTESSDHHFPCDRVTTLPDNSSNLEANGASVRLANHVGPTTYFSVDSCMTDTYRVKYHERPKLCFGEMKGNESQQSDDPFQGSYN
ncbi:inactive ubiquitin carboxyl-terminal hydrolase 53-like [Narcine bancroftii]|uniref:inactive ubiquitin carboxyl-terminal hydrolase 53-like n=1 Tax=Narcine bancroftii TaxID=1343680 RepID=UPI003831BA59